MYICICVCICVRMCICISADPIGVERVRAATITNNQPPSPISKQGSIHHLVQSPDTETCLPGQPISQPAESPMTNHCHQPAQPQATSQPSPCPRASSHQSPVTRPQPPARQPGSYLPIANGLPIEYQWIRSGSQLIRIPLTFGSKQSFKETHSHP